MGKRPFYWRLLLRGSSYSRSRSCIRAMGNASARFCHSMTPMYTTHLLPLLWSVLHCVSKVLRLHCTHYVSHQAHLSPGDMLYLPPLWFHEVMATTTRLGWSEVVYCALSLIVCVLCSVSVNAWVGTTEEEAAEQLFKLKPPFKRMAAGASNTYARAAQACCGDLALMFARYRLCQAYYQYTCNGGSCNLCGVGRHGTV